MDRFAVTTENGVMHLYYPSIDDAKRSWPNARIEPYDDDGYLRYIDLLIDAADDSCIDYRGRTVLRRLFPWGELKLRLTRMGDSWYDMCEFQEQNNNAHIVNFMWTLSEPKLVWEKFFGYEVRYELLQCVCKSYGQRPIKPKELKGMKPVFGVKFIKLKSQVFVKDNDIYIYHNEYFCPEMPIDPADYGTPFSYRANKYLGKNASKKFIYDDNWGSILLHNVAWCKFVNFMKLFEIMKPNDIALLMRDKTYDFHNFDKTKGDTFQWLAFYEQICNGIVDHMK